MRIIVFGSLSVRPLFLGSYSNYVTHFKRGGGGKTLQCVILIGGGGGVSLSASYDC